MEAAWRRPSKAKAGAHDDGGNAPRPHCVGKPYALVPSHSDGDGGSDGDGDGGGGTARPPLQALAGDCKGQAPAAGAGAAGAGVAATAANLVTMMIGASILGTPALFSRTGLVLGTVLLLSACCLSVYLCGILGEAIGQAQARLACRVDKLDDLAGACFGAAGRALTRALVNSFFVAKVCLYLVLIGQNMNYICPSLPYRGGVLLATGMSMPVAFLRDVSKITKLSFLGVVASFLTCVCMVGGAVEASGKPDRRFEVQPGFPSAGALLSSAFSALTILVFGFGPADVLATVRREMREPHRLLRALIVSHALVMAIYWAVGSFGLWGFGASVASNVNLSMCDAPGCSGQNGILEGEGGAKWIWGYVLALAMLINLSVTIPIVLYCLFSGVESCYPPEAPMKRIPNAAMRISVVLFCSAVGLSLPFFLHIVAIISSAMCVPLVFFLPLSFSWKVARDTGAPHSSTRTAADCFVLVVGVLALAVGLSESVVDLRRAIREQPDAVDVFGNLWK